MKKKNIRKRDLIIGLWAVGLGFLLITDNFWPGILVLVVLSMLFKTIYKESAPEQVEPGEFRYDPISSKAEEPPRAEPALVESAPQPVETPPAWNDTALLPPRCPRCGAPVAAGQVIWTGTRSADCPYRGGGLIL